MACTPGARCGALRVYDARSAWDWESRVKPKTTWYNKNTQQRR